jgi:hypothetical protein
MTHIPPLREDALEKAAQWLVDTRQVFGNDDDKQEALDLARDAITVYLKVEAEAGRAISDVLKLKDGDTVVLYSTHRQIVDLLMRMNELLVRAVVGAELDLQYNRPVEAHSKLSAAWKEWLGETVDRKAEPYTANAPLEQDRTGKG